MGTAFLEAEIKKRKTNCNGMTELDIFKVMAIRMSKVTL